MNLPTFWPATLAVAALMLCTPTRALAFATGSPTEGCGCHGGGSTPTVLITPDLTAIDPGQAMTLTVSVSATNGKAAGFFLEASVGQFNIVESGTKLSGNGNGVTHSAVKRTTSSDTPITFKVGWTAPAEPGGVDFSAWGNSANGDGTSRGDAEGKGFFSTAVGCAGTKYFHDYDGDGMGAESSGYTVACSLPPNFSTRAGDCNDNDPKVFEGAAEICDGKDNNCDGQVDEGLPVTAYCTDADADGHGVVGQATVMGCGPSKGFGLCDNDCNDQDATVYPGATELCNNKDDNCNDRVDENARAICGVGWCAQYAEGCTSTCTPGLPRAEECNDFDDDCDGVNDNGSDLQLCGKPGFACRAGYCVPSDAGAAGTAAGSGGASANNGGSASFGSGSAASASAGSAPVVPSAGVSNAAASPARSAGCSVAFGDTRAPLGAAGLVLAVTVLRRRKRR